MKHSDQSISKRKYHAFLSHAHTDKNIVDEIYGLLAHKAGLTIWYDSDSLTSSNKIGTKLPEQIEQCKSLL